MNTKPALVVAAGAGAAPAVKEKPPDAAGAGALVAAVDPPNVKPCELIPVPVADAALGKAN